MGVKLVRIAVIHLPPYRPCQPFYQVGWSPGTRFDWTKKWPRCFPSRTARSKNLTIVNNRRGEEAGGPCQPGGMAPVSWSWEKLKGWPGLSFYLKF
jgi:hypothetical protein